MRHSPARRTGRVSPSRLVLALALVIAPAVGTCAPAERPPVLHLLNRSTAAVIVQVGGSPPIAATAIRPCGATDVLLSGSDQRGVTLLVDPAGAFDAALEAWAGDPADMPGSFVADPIWSAGNVAPVRSVLVVDADQGVWFDATPEAPLPSPGCLEPAPS